MKIDARGKQCPLPVLEAKKALESAEPGEAIEVLVDNEIAVQNLQKLADRKAVAFSYEKLGSRTFAVKFAGGEDAEKYAEDHADETEDMDEVCQLDGIRSGMTVVLSSAWMGHGDEALGALLMKGFVYALTQQDVLPQTVLLYNGGARLSCEGSDSVEDLKYLESRGVEILTCGTCLNHYGLSDQLQAGSVTNMYEIAEKMTAARILVKP